MLECIAGAVRFVQRKNLDARSNRNFSRHAQEVFAVLPRIVRHAPNLSLFVQQIVAKRWDRAHMNPAKNERAAFLEGLQRSGNYLAGRRKTIVASSFFGGSLSVPPAH